MDSLCNLGKKFYFTSVKTVKPLLKFINLDYAVSDIENDLTRLTRNFIKDLKNKNITFVSVTANVKQVNENRYSLGNRFPLDLTDPKSQATYIDYLNNKYAALEARYKEVKAETIFYNYTAINEVLYQNSKIRYDNRVEAKKVINNIDYRNEIPANFPANTDYSTWGTRNKWIDSKTLRVWDLTMDRGNFLIKRHILVTFLDSKTRVIEIFSSLAGSKVQKFTDTVVSAVEDEFVRKVGERYFHFLNGSVRFIFDKLFASKEKITKGRKDKKFHLNMITLDIETFVNSDKKMDLLCLSFFDGSTSESFYISDFNSVKELMNAVLKRLLVKGNSKKNIYIHNSSNFDLVFILKHIANYPGVELEPIIRDGKFINLKIKYGSKKEFFVDMRDSFLLLPVSLKDLAEQFKVSTLKGLFPYSFVNRDNLNYVGSVPKFEFFSKINSLDYNSYKQEFVNKKWNLKTEAVKYCEQDCIALYRVLETFGKFIFDLFQLNISSVSTLPSLAFKIYRAHFLPKTINLPVLVGEIYSAISQAYYGGHVDMFIPKMSDPENDLVFHYDVNGLYPNAMKSHCYPTNVFAHFYGDIRQMKEYVDLFTNENYVSFLKVRVTTPSGITNPILPYKKDGTTIYGEGRWTGWYYSEEILNAVNYGYKFEILEGYLCETSDLFSGYVDKFSEIKQQSNPGDPMYIIAKLLLNSLYGRFGMSPKTLSHIILNRDDISDFTHKVGLDNLMQQVELDNKLLVSYWQDFTKAPQINIAIAAAITANARVYMSVFKNHPDFVLYYTDTDSYFINKPLPAELVDRKKLGLFKLEATLVDFVALGPKVYGGKTIQGVEFTKVKGLKTPVSLGQLKALLQKDNILNLNQSKWYNQITDSTISIRDMAYNLKPTSDKRDLIYRNGVLAGTSNKIINED